MMTVALTGNVGSGKSTVASIWRDQGVPLVDADELARRVVEPGSPGLAAVVEAFGPEVVGSDGVLDRDTLREVVFREPEKRERLESILHPLIRAHRDEWIEARREENAAVVVAEIPLLFETGLEREFDVSVFIAASKETCLRRIAESRGITPEEGELIWEAQMDPAEKADRSDYTIWNEAGLEDLREQALALLDLLRARARK